MVMWDQVLNGNIIQCLHTAHSILMLKPFLCLVFWLVLVFVIAPIGSVYAHFIVDDIAVPFILDNTQKPSQVL